MACLPTYKGKRYNSLEELKSSQITPQQKQQALQLYSQYLDTIGVTDIGYHHSESDLESFTTFSEGYFPKELKKKGTHYKEADDIVFFVKKPLTEEFMSKRKFTGTWGLKIPNTLQFNTGEKVGEGVHPGIDEGIKNAVNGKYDAVDFGRIRDNKTWSEVVAITNPKNAVKLGSKQDIEGFKEFVGRKNPDFNISKKQELENLSNNKWFRKVIQPVINRFSKMFPNIRVNVISINEIPKEVQAKVDGLDKQINSFYHKGQVYIIKERVTKDITIEEFLHPFVNALEKDNPELYKSLLGEAKQLFPELKEQIFQDYDKVYSSIFDKNREFLTQALTKKVSEFTPEQQSWFDKFKTWLKSILDRMFGNDFTQRDISTLDEKMSLTDLASILSENNTSFDIKGDEMTYYSLSSEEVDFYLNTPSEPLQREILTKVLENNKLVEFEEESHQYFINPDGEKRELIPVSKVIYKAKFDNKYEGFIEMGNVIHDLVKNINLNEKYVVKEDSEIVDFLVNQKGYPLDTVKTIYQNIYDYISYLKNNGSILVSEVSIHALDNNFGNQYAGIAGTIDLLEIKKDGSVAIHDFKSMFLDYKKVFETSPSTLTKNKFQLKKQGFSEQLSLYAKMLKGILDVKNIDLQIVPISYVADVNKEGDVISFNVPENLEIKDRPEIVNGIFNPLKVINTSKDFYSVVYNKKYADKIIPSIVEPIEEKTKTKEQIDREKVLSTLTTKIQEDNSKEFEKQLENTFKGIVDIYKKYGESKDELNKKLYEIFDENGLFAKTKIDWNSLYDRMKEMTDDNPDKVKFYLSTLVQYMNYIEEMTIGIKNIRGNFSKIVANSEKLSNQELLSLMKKSYDLAQYNKSYISATLAELSDVEEDNILIKSLTYALKDIEQIENEYFKRSLPIISEILNKYFTEEAKQKMIEEYRQRLAQKQYSADKATGSAREKYLKEIEDIQKKIDLMPSPNVIAKVIQGEFGDADWFFSNLFANINNDDYIIAGTEKYMTDIMKDLQDIATIKQEETGRIFEEYLKAVGGTKDNPKELNSDLVYEVKKLIRKKDGTTETIIQLTHLTDVDQNVFYEEDLLKYKVETSEGEELVKAKKALSEFRKEHQESKYSSAYQKILDSLDIQLSDGRTIKDVYQEKLRNIQDIQIRNNRKDYNEGNLEDEVYIEMREAWRDYNNLYSIYDRNGNKKTGDDLKIAEILKERRAKLDAFRTKKSDKQAWEANRAKKIAELLTKYKNEQEVLQSEEFKKWQSINSVVTPSKDFYDERANTLEKINQLLDKREYKDEAAAKNLKLVLNQYWEQMTSIVKEYRDFEREIQAGDIPETVKEQLKSLEETITSTTNQIKLLQEKMSRADAKELSDLYEQYNSMVEYKTSKYYQDDYQKALAEFAIEKDLSITEIEADEDLISEFKLTNEWYKNSHVQKFRYNPVLGESVLTTEPVYYYKIFIPTNPDYIEEQPAAQYSSFELKPEALNPNYLDQFGRPRIKSSSKYVAENFKYLKLKNATDSKGKAIYKAVKHLQQRAEEAQLGLDPHNYIYYAVPSRQKTLSERVLGDGGKGLWTNVKNKFVKTEEDEEIMGTRSALTTMVGEEAKFIPVTGKFKIDIKDQSYNVWGASLDFYLSAEKSKLFTKHLPTMEVLVDQLKRSTNQPNEEGMVDAIANKLKQTVGLQNISTSVKGKTNLRLRNVEDIINRYVYDEWQKEIKTMFGVSDVKLTNTLLGAAGSNMMMLNIPNWFVNFASGNIQIMIESAGKRYFTSKDVASAKIELFAKLKKDLLSDISKTHNKSLIGQMIDYYDPMKGEYLNEYGEKFTWSKRTNLRDVLFFGKNLGEFEMQMTTFIAMLKAKKVKQILPNGQENIISLYDAYEKGENGIPKLKEGVQFTKEQEREYMLKIHAINKKLNGAYAKMDQTFVENYSIGRLLFFMKKFFLPLWANRYFKIRGDWEVGDVAEGHYYAFYDTIMKDFYRLKGNLPEILAKWKLSPEEGGYTELQKQAIKKTITEIAFVAAMFAALSLLGYDDGEDDTDAQKYSQYFFLKLRKEIATFTPVLAPQEFIGIFSRPIAAASYIGNTANLVGTSIKTAIYYPTGWFEDDVLYQKKTALFEKGDSKMIGLLYKFAGLKVNVLEPQQLLQGYNYSIRY